MHTMSHFDSSRRLLFVRHGATEPNLRGLRCGGDLDAALTDVGRLQAAEAGQRIRALDIPVGVIVTSQLQRAHESAEIISRLLHGVKVVIEPAFAERRLGAWNMRSIADTEKDFAARATPPGGESNGEFFDRIGAAVETLLPRLEQRPLLVGSKGVARILGELLGMPARQGIANGEMIHFDFPTFSMRNAVGCEA